MGMRVGFMGQTEHSCLKSYGNFCFNLAPNAVGVDVLLRRCERLGGDGAVVCGGVRRSRGARRRRCPCSGGRESLGKLGHGGNGWRRALIRQAVGCLSRGVGLAGRGRGESDQRRVWVV
jgi:hypothetical protein